MRRLDDASFIMPYKVTADIIKTSLNKELSRVGVHEIKLQLINELPLAALDEVYMLLKNSVKPSEFDAVGKLCYKPKQWFNEIQIASFRQQISIACGKLQECQRDVKMKQNTKHRFSYKSHLRKAQQAYGAAQEEYINTVKRFAELIWLICVYD